MMGTKQKLRGKLNEFRNKKYAITRVLAPKQSEDNFIEEFCFHIAEFLKGNVGKYKDILGDPYRDEGAFIKDFKYYYTYIKRHPSGGDDIKYKDMMPEIEELYQLCMSLYKEMKDKGTWGSVFGGSDFILRSCKEIERMLRKG